MEQATDIELARLAASGDEAAFERLASRHYGLAYRLAYKYCGVREDAEDVAQEVLVRMARGIGEFKAESGFTTWLFRIAVNTAKDHLRSRARTLAHDAAYADSLRHESGGTDNPVSSATLYRALSTLPENYKDALMLVLAEGMNHREAAAVLGCAEATISWRIFRAKGMLRKLLKTEEA